MPCPLCRARLETPVLRNTRFWRTALNRNQNLLGKMIIVLRRHEEAIAALSADEWAELAGEVRWATERLNVAFRPDHINYAFLQNQDRHVHLHVIPRYEQPRTIADVAFDDPDYPGHYTPGVERRLASDVMASIAAALKEDA